MDNAAAQDKDYQPRAKVIESPQLDPTAGFDLRTHIKDAKTNKLIRLQPYARHARNDEVLYERPIGSGNCYHENGVPAGNWKFHQQKDDVRWEKVSDKHVATKAAPVDHLEEAYQKIEMLERELAARDSEKTGKRT